MQFDTLKQKCSIGESRGMIIPLRSKIVSHFFQKAIFLLRSESAIKGLARAFENTKEHRNRIRNRGAIYKKPWGEQ